MPEGTDLFLWFGVPGPGQWHDFLPHLVAAERERAARFRHADDRWTYVTAHAGLRTILSSMLGIAPHEIGFVVEQKGKPKLDPTRHARAADAVQFNISHTRGLVAVAVATHSVGIDVERRHAMDDLLAIADRVFAEESC